MDRNVLIIASLASMAMAVNLHQYVTRNYNAGFIPAFGGHGYSTVSVDYGSIYKARKTSRRAKNIKRNRR